MSKCDGNTAQDNTCFICLNEDLPISKVTRSTKKVNWICCDCCKNWLHANCGGVNASQYTKITKGNIWFKCIVCCFYQLQNTDCEDRYSEVDSSFASRVLEAVEKRASNTGGKSKGKSKKSKEYIVDSVATQHLPAVIDIASQHLESTDQSTLNTACTQSSAVLHHFADKEVTLHSVADTDNILVIDDIENAGEFNSSRRILQEIHNFCPDTKVEFAYSLAKGGVAIHTKSKVERDHLLESLPRESFGRGVKHLPKGIIGKVLFIKGVDTSVHLSSITEQLKQEGIEVLEARRLIRRHTGIPIQVVRVRCAEKSVNVLLNTRLVINNRLCKIEQDRGIRVIRCFNCQGFGHLAKHCKSNRHCEICAQTHGEHEGCGGKVHCHNCRGNHPASSSVCPVYISRYEEIWHPTDGSLSIRNYAQPITKIRQNGEGGGVAIVPHRSVKCVHLKEFDVDSLEAVWADVMVDKVRTVVGSVYIPPGDILALDVLDTVIGKILLSHDHVVIAMDANSRNVLWDDKCIGITTSRRSIQMGNKLEAILDKHGLTVLNSGVCTYRSGNVCSAPDVTLIKGLTQHGTVRWSVIDDDLGSPHEGILIDVGNRARAGRRSVIDWRKFDWQAYRDVTTECLNDVYDKWVKFPDTDVDDMVTELTSHIQNCVDNIATMKVVTEHSKPWITPHISAQLKLLRQARKKCRFRKSPFNVAEFDKLRKETVDMISKAEKEWWQQECKKLSEVSTNEKWKIIRRLTTDSFTTDVQPIKKFDQGKMVYAFNDDEIRKELEEYHIRKDCLNGRCVDSLGVCENELLQDMVVKAKFGDGNELMNAPISDHEVKCTFGKGSNTPGPDGISARLIDEADRELMHGCLSLLWNRAWLSGYFAAAWKLENRIILPKPGKEDYNECNSYRTVSITSSLGKRFEHITARRLVAVLDQLRFDLDQYAYLKNRSTTHSTQALLFLVEKIKKALLHGEKGAAVFFDFTDAFGSVNRKRLLYKIGNDFGISGKLFLHIQSFLADRYARLRIANSEGEWIQSILGTSAGTMLGPLLFILNMHDVPRCILPKFADDLVAFSVGSDMRSINEKLQQSAEQLQEWANREGMELNVSKTKVMVFGCHKDNFDIKLNGISVEKVDSYKYLGIVLDPELNFSMQTEYAVGKAKRASNKVFRLLDGDHGIPVQIGLNLYKTIVRPHMEYGLPVWASVKDKDIDEMEYVQTRFLKRIVGAKTHSGTASVEVVSGIPPFRLRKRELCNREYVRIQSMEKDHVLVQLTQDSTRVGLRFCPLEYIKVMSKELDRAIDGCTIVAQGNILSDVIQCQKLSTRISVCEVRGNYSFDCASGVIQDKENVIKFIQDHQGTSALVFTDGSVYGSPVGCGACAAVLFPLSDTENWQITTSPVGKRVSSVCCEIEGIVLGMELATTYLNQCLTRKPTECVYVFCDCLEAIEEIVNKFDSNKNSKVIKRLLCLEKKLKDISVFVKLVPITGHSGVFGNDIADQEARELAQNIVRGRVCASEVISINDGYRIAREILKKSWQRKWSEELTGRYTYDLLPVVGKNVIFPSNRNVGVSYCRMLLHDTFLNGDGFRTGISDTALCSCGEEKESVEHVLLRCCENEEARTVLLDCVSDILKSSRCTANQKLDITESLLLAPYGQSNCLSRREDIVCKEALFEFIASVDKRI